MLTEDADSLAMTILYVEDNPDHAELVMRCLERRQVREHVHHVDDGEAALAYLRGVSLGREARPALVLLDLRLPKIDGIEVLRELKDTPTLRDIAVVVFTTSENANDVAEAYRHHANSYLVKPDDLVRLDELLGDLHAYWLVRNRRLPAGAIAPS